MFALLRTLNADLFNRIFLSMAAMFAYLLIAGLFLLHQGKKEKNIPQKKLNPVHDSPFKLGAAIKLGAIIISALIAANIILAFANIEIYYILGSLMAFFSVDEPVIISTASIAGKIISLTDAKNIILTVIYLNFAQKIATVYFFGNRKLAKPLAYVFGGLFLVTLACFLYL